MRARVDSKVCGVGGIDSYLDYIEELCRRELFETDEFSKNPKFGRQVGERGERNFRS